MNEREVIGGLALIADEESPEAVVPAVGSLDDPPARFPANAADERLLAATSNVRNDASISNLAFRVRVVEALVQAEVRGTARAARRPKDDGVQSGTGHPFVVHVRRGDLDGYRDAAAFGQDVAFCAEFCAIGGVGAGVVPPFGAFTLALSSEHHLRSTPTRSS